MISLIRWKEFGDENAPSIKTAINDAPYPEKKRIIEYLKRGKVTATAPGVGVDAISGKTVDNHLFLQTDGEYSWANMLAYYVDVYNVRLPQDFVNKAMR